MAFKLPAVLNRMTFNFLKRLGIAFNKKHRTVTRMNTLDRQRKLFVRAKVPIRITARTEG